MLSSLTIAKTRLSAERLKFSCKRPPERSEEGRLPAAGWPQGITPPGLPLIRTCGFPASGSSGHGFAIPDAIRPSFVEMLDGLSVPGIVPSDGSVTRSPLPSAGSLGQLSQRSQVVWATPTPHRPSHFALVVPRLGGTGARLATTPETTGSLAFLGDLWTHATLSDSGGTLAPSH